ncbi:MAG: ABC transporter ATP-binding protein [Alphaproteobacteria bacterium]
MAGVKADPGRYRDTVPDTDVAAPAIAIDIRGVTKIFGSSESAVRALDAVDLGIRENEFFTLLGPSGCGKTTLLRLIAGFDHPNGGQIFLDGIDIAPLPPYRRPINTVFQNYALFPHMTVAGNIGFGLEMLGKPKAEVAERVDAMLRLVRMEALKDRRTSEISGGQQQRVALARALAPAPKVLLLDEPLSALDLKLRKEMQIELKRLQHETGITFVFVTHDQEEALTMSDRIAVMHDGHILQVGTPRDIYERPAERFVADFIGETNFLTGRAIEVGEGWATLELNGDRRVKAAVPDGFEPAGEVTVVVRPEHAVLADEGEQADLAGIIDNIIYVGTDSHVRVRLDDASLFTLRVQNVGADHAALDEGRRTGIRFRPGAARVLKD